MTKLKTVIHKIFCYCMSVAIAFAREQHTGYFLLSLQLKKPTPVFHNKNISRMSG